MAPRILVVEDDADIRQVMAEALESQGYEVALAPDGAVALRLAREDRPDLILLDLMMPRMDGWSFRRAQLADEALADIPVVVVSAVGPDRLATVDADEVMVKPFGLDALFDTVARLGAGRPSRPPQPRAAAQVQGEAAHGM
ncbi:MAG TPA: response regulator transcription factor [Anaeromyxobacteraceae bacterium]|nr:response regulator transcription factor [Anaeromyxobacteraceae bacterium]